MRSNRRPRRQLPAIHHSFQHQARTNVPSPNRDNRQLSSPRLAMSPSKLSLASIDLEGPRMGRNRYGGGLQQADMVTLPQIEHTSKFTPPG